MSISLDILTQHFKRVASLNTPPDGADQVNDYINAELNVEIDEDINFILNGSLTEDEILTCIKTLKNNKSSGVDCILNEYIKASAHILLPVWCKLFNFVLSTGNIPESWLIGDIVPLYKNKGSKDDPNNYRGITLLSCTGKLFTSLLNRRLNNFAEAFNVIHENQAGFRKKHSTMDHIFTIHCLIDIFKAQKIQLYCAFIDYEKAFDNIWHDGMWYKLLKAGVKGNIFTVIQNMYKNIKSSVKGDNSQFQCFKGLRQGENLSPFLFSLYLNDLEEFLMEHDCSSLILSVDKDLKPYVKLLLLMYADDTILVADSANDLQEAMDCLNVYCKKWDIKINIDKTKIVIFTNRKKRENANFNFNGQLIDIVDNFKYLGVLFSRNGSFHMNNVERLNRARRAMFSLLSKCKCQDIPIDVQIDLFDNMIAPVAGYGSEIWGFENLKMFDKLQIRFYKYLLKLKKSTPDYMVLGEVGKYPLSLTLKQNMLRYWFNLARANINSDNKLSIKLYKTIRRLADSKLVKSKWLDGVKNILNECGMYFLWENCKDINKEWFKNAVKQRLIDQFIQLWNFELENSQKGYNYRIFKTEFKTENYINSCISDSLKILFCKFRTCNHQLAVEMGRYQDIPREDRSCTVCDSLVLGDEYHFILECPSLNLIRDKYLPKYYTRHPSAIKFGELLSTKKKKLLAKVVRYIKEAMVLYNDLKNPIT